MSIQPSVEPYDITRGENVTYGYYTVLDLVFSRFINELESLFYDLFRLTIDFDFQIQSDIKFKNYLTSLTRPEPIFVFDVTPHLGDCLLKLDNQSANLLLSRKRFQKNQVPAVSDDFAVTSDNYTRLQAPIEQSLNRYSRCWAQFFPARGSLKKLVSNKIKAKIMEQQDACVVVDLFLRHAGIDANWQFCFSAYRLDQIIKTYGVKVLLAGSGLKDGSEETKSKFVDFLTTNARYSLQGVLGQLNVSEKQIVEHYESGGAIPIKSNIQDNVTIYINQKPMLAAVAGNTHDTISLKVKGKYKKARDDYKSQSKPFTELSFPSK